MTSIGMRDSPSSAYWNEIWKEEDLGPQWKHYAAAELVASQPVLDVGCGSGVLLGMLAGRGFERLLGLDISAESMKKLSGKGLRALRCDFSRALPFRSDSFATVTLVDVLEHVFDPTRLLTEASRLAREVVVVVPNFNSVAARMQVLSGRVPENNTPRKRHAYWFNYEALHRTMAACNLEPVEERFQTFKSGHRLAGPIFAALGRARPQLFALSFAIKARRRETRT